MPIHRRPNSSHAIKVVPEPQKKSKTKLSLFDEILTICFSISKFFSVGYDGY